MNTGFEAVFGGQRQVGDREVLILHWPFSVTLRDSKLIWLTANTCLFGVTFM